MNNALSDGRRNERALPHWMLLYIALPMTLLVALLVTRWGKENLIFYIALAPLLIVFRMYLSSLRHLRTGADQHSAVASAQRWAYHFEVCAWIVLMILSIAIAVAAEVRAAPSVIAILFVGLFGLYWALLYAAKEQLRDADISKEFESSKRRNT